MPPRLQGFSHFLQNFDPSLPWQQALNILEPVLGQHAMLALVHSTPEWKRPQRKTHR
jgi:hypothetical protein